MDPCRYLSITTQHILSPLMEATMDRERPIAPGRRSTARPKGPRPEIRSLSMAADMFCLLKSAHAIPGDPMHGSLISDIPVKSPYWTRNRFNYPRLFKGF